MSPFSGEQPLLERLGARLHEFRQDRAIRKSWQRKAGLATPVLVYQMGKVGSSSFYESLKAHYPGVVIHTHSMSPKSRHWSSRWLHRTFVEEGHPVRILCPVREPVSRSVSAFFQNFAIYTGMPPRKWKGSREQLLQIFLDSGCHRRSLDWFERNLLKHFNLNVYDHHLDGEYLHITEGVVELMVFRLEDDDAVHEKALCALTGLETCPLREANISERKEYAELYRDFVENVRLPRETLSEMLDSTLFQHFYGDVMRQKVLERWG